MSLITERRRRALSSDHFRVTSLSRARSNSRHYTRRACVNGRRPAPRTSRRTEDRKPYRSRSRVVLLRERDVSRRVRPPSLTQTHAGRASRRYERRACVSLARPARRKCAPSHATYSVKLPPPLRFPESLHRYNRRVTCTILSWTLDSFLRFRGGIATQQ